jgi:hypothetical protein
MIIMQSQVSRFAQLFGTGDRWLDREAPSTGPFPKPSGRAYPGTHNWIKREHCPSPKNRAAILVELRSAQL